MSLSSVQDAIKKYRLLLIIGGIALYSIVILALGTKLGKPKVVVEKPAEAIQLPGGALALEKQPNKDAKPAQEIPKGSTVERIVYVNARPHAEVPAPTSGTSQGALASQANASPRKIRIDMTMVRMSDGQRRVVVSSPDADIEGGMDIPVENTAAPEDYRHALGLRVSIRDDGSKALGPTYSYDLGRFRITADAAVVTYTSRVGGEIGVALTFRF